MTPGALWALLWGDGGQYHEVKVGSATCWVPTHKRRAFVELMLEPDVRVSFVPRTERDAFAVAQTHVLWARLERPASADLLSRLPVGPTLVIREGRSSRRTALWALSRPVSGDWIARGNERLSHACKGRRRTADPSSLFESPFSPDKTYVEYEDAGPFHTAREIVGRLRDAPATDGWRNQVQP
jgi:hypothetical protein